MKSAVSFSCLGGYRRFCDAWWLDLLRYWTPIRARASYERDGAMWRTVRVGWPGWCLDLYAFWHRGRYGWAPRDTWSLDHYLNGVLAGALAHLADTANGVPGGYARDGEDVDAAYERWVADLRRWALAFHESPDAVEIYDRPHYTKHNAEESRRRANLQAALNEMTPWWEALWN